MNYADSTTGGFVLLSGYHNKPHTRIISLHLLVTFVLALAVPPAARADTDTESLQEQWDKVSSSRRSADYRDAIETLRSIIEQYSDTDRVLREAYSQLVWTYLKSGDEEAARGVAREALERYPDITANETYIIPGVNRTYEELRRQMFGSLEIEDPEEGHVFLNDEHIGDSPLYKNLVRVGEYNLLVTKSGYEDYTQTIQIDPDQKLTLSLSMSRTRDWKWWTWRGGAVVLAAVAIGFGLSAGGDEGTPPDEPLPPPPAPPTN